MTALSEKHGKHFRELSPVLFWSYLSKEDYACWVNVIAPFHPSI